MTGVVTGVLTADLTAGDLAAIVVTMVSIGAVVALLVALQAVWRDLRAMRVTVADVEQRARVAADQLEGTVTAANEQLRRMDELIGSAESISATVDATSRLAYKALSAPVIKTVAIASGTSKAAKRLRKER